ncbi:PAS domain S-box protein [Gemmata sp.]|uniref:PAS domain S-box protein n=1 Tax=Gemmata sp. TaxID=1914242 RepID=UPI003F6E99FE
MPTPLRVLIVEDQPAADGMAGALRQGGFEPACERVGSAAALRAALAAGPWDAVLCGCEAPGFGGLPALEIVRGHDADLPLVVVSGTIGEERAAEAIRAGANDFILKGQIGRLGPAVEREVRAAADRRARRAAERDAFRLAAIVASTEEAITAETPDGVLTSWNPGAERLFGYAAAEVLGRPFAVLVPEDGRAEHDAATALVRATAAPHHFETVRLRRDGGRVHVAATVAPILDAAGAVVGYSRVLRDIGDKVRAAEAVAASERRFRALVENSLEGFLLLDGAGTVLYASPSRVRVGGQGLDAYAGRTVREWVHPEDAAVLDGRWAEVLRRPGGTTFCVVRFRRHDAVWGHAAITHTNLLHDPDLRAVVCNFRDVTARVAIDAHRKQVTEELDRTSQLLRAVADSTTDAIFVKDRAGRYLLFNAAASGFVGKPIEEVLGRDDTALFEPDSARRVLDRDQEVMESGRATTEEEVLTAGGVTRVYQATKAPYRDSDGAVVGLVGVSRDVTAQKRGEEALRASEEQLRAVVEAQTEAVCRVRADRTIVFANEVFCRLVGRAPHDLVGLTGPAVTHPDDVAVVEAALANLSPGNPVVRVVNRLVDPAGSVRWMEFVNRGFFGPAGELVEFQAVGRDVTAQRRAEEALRQSAEAERRAAATTRAIVNALPAHIALLDGDGTIVAVNEAWERFAHANAHTGAGSGTGENYIGVCLRARGECAEEAAGVRAVLAGDGTDFVLEYPCHSPHERRWYRMMATALAPGRAGGAVVMHVNVTERRLAEESLRASEERLRLAVEATGMGTFDWDVAADRIDWDDRGRAVFGVAPGENTGLDAFLARLLPDDRGPAAEQVRAALDPTGGGAFQAEYRVLGPDRAAPRWVAARGQVWFEGTGPGRRPVRFVGAVLDVTDRREADAALRDKEAKLAEALRLARMGYWTRDAATGALEWSEELHAIFGTDPAALELTFEAFLGLVHPDDRGWVRTRIAEAEAAAASFEHTYRVVTGAGVRVIHEVGHVFADAAGRPHRVAGTAQDVTDRVRVEHELLLRDRAIRAVTQGIVITDAGQPDNPVIFASPGFERLTGYSAAEILGRNCRFLQGADTDRGAVARVRGAVAAHEPWTVELLNYRKDGTPFWNELSVSPVRDDAGRLTHFVGVQVDVTARRQLEEQFRQAQKMEAIGQLAGGVAHDFNNLLTVINGYSEVLLDTLLPGDPAREMVEEIHGAGERSAGLTRQLLAFSRKQVLAPRVLSLNAVLTGAERILRRVIGEDVALATDLDPELGAVRADPGQLEQVVLNLAVNARDAMPTGGRLTIRTRNADLSADAARRHHGAQPGPHVVLSVGDTGGGMTPEVRARIFEPFFTTKGPGQGTGLGLATVFGIVQQSGGAIDVESAPGAGSTFRVYLPRVEGGNGATPRSGVRKIPTGTETLLLVEDETAVRNFARQVLTGCGYAVLTAGDGDEAVRVAGEHRGPIHLLVTDVVIPGGGGRVSAERVTARHPEARVLFMSGYTDDAVVRHGVLSQQANFLQKPFSPVALACKVREVLDAPGPRVTGSAG